MQVLLIQFVPYIVIVAAAIVFSYRRLLNYLRFFQQEEYNDRRFLAWIMRHRAFDRKGSLLSICVLALIVLTKSFLPSLPLVLFGGIALVWLAFREENPRATG